MAVTPLLLSASNAAERLGVSLWRLRQFCHRRQLEHVRVGTSILVPADALDQFIVEHLVPPGQAPVDAQVPAPDDAA